MAEVYDLEIDLNADTSHTRTIRLTGQGKRVLEFGCATGYVSKILTEQFGCIVTGIELNPHAAAKARPRCHRVICGDAETLDYAKELDGERFDVILFADVLEHLKDPWAVLRRTKDLIEADGYVVASIPNIGHAAVGLELLAGRFAYRPLGLLGGTPLRFFSRRSIYELFESTGYVVAELDRIDAEPSATEFQTKLAAFPPKVVEFALRQDEALTDQFIVKAFPATEAGALAELRRKLEQLEAARDAVYGRLHQDLETSRGALAEREAETAQLRQDLETTRGALAEREVEAAQLRQDLETSRGALAEREAETTQLRQDLETTRGALAEREAETTQLRQDLETTRGALAEGEAETAQLSQGLETTRAAREELELLVDAHVARLGELATDRARAEAQVAAVHRELEQGGRRIADLERSLEDARAQLGTAEAQRRLAEDRIAIVERSRSWRLTAPLRDSRGMASRAMLRGRVALADGARAIYRLRSLTSETKVRLKDLVFASVPSLVRATGDSKRWQQEHKRTRAALVTPFEQPAPVSRRPRIVVVSHDALFYGAQLLALTLARTLAEQLGYEVEVLLCGDGPLRSDFERVGRVHDFFSSTTAVEGRERLLRDLYERGARVALCNTGCVGDTVELLKSAGFTVVSMIHELPGLIREYGLETSCAKIARDADRVVFPADVVRRSFIELTGMPPEKAVVRAQGLLAPNRFAGQRREARSQLRGRLRLDDGVAIVLGMGPADRRKGIDLFVDVGLKLWRRLEDVVFVWVGHLNTSAFASAQARIAEAGAETRFAFPGPIEKPDMFFAGADAYLMTSREDPFPLVVLHALEAELPVIGFEGGGGFVELLQRDCGILVEYLDTAAMAEALLRLLNDPGERQRLGARGREIIIREFSFVDYARDLVRLVDFHRPSVSVIVPNYNYAHYLPTRLRSILAQTYTLHEIIFLDDCSSDGSAEVAEALLSEADIPYRIIRNETNQGCYRQWLRGICEATGDLVWIAEADDDCAPTLVESLVRAFARERVVLAYSQSKQIDDEGAELAPDYLGWTADINPTKWRHAYVRDGKDEIRDSLAVKNTIPNVSAVLMRRPDLSEIEPLLVTLRHAGDWLVYVHLLERGDVAFLPVALNYHRRHRQSIIGGHGRIEDGALNLMRETLLVQRYVVGRHSLAPEVERMREVQRQATYEFLGLDASGPPSYRDHDALRDASSVVAG